jgi:hypothetical protein
VRIAGLWSVLPAASRARTWNSCEPGETVYETGELQGEKPAWSSEHSKLEPLSVEVKVKLAPVLGVVAGGPEVIVVSGAVVSGACTVQVELAGVESVFPAASLAWTWNWCWPAATVYEAGDVQGEKPARSSEHSKLEPVSLEVKVKVALVLVVVGGGPDAMVVCGAVVSTVKAWVAGVASTLPAASVARARRVCGPSARRAVVCGEVQRANVPASTAHSKVAASFAETSKVGVVSFVGPLGPDPIVVSGGVVSTVNGRLAGVASAFPAASLARTSKVYPPSARAAVVWGDVQDSNAPEPMRHWKLAPGSLENVNMGVVSFVEPVGPVSIAVSGAVVSGASTVQAKLAGLGSALPAASRACTRSWCGPTARPVT